jgi:hypothetical protein
MVMLSPLEAESNRVQAKSKYPSLESDVVLFTLKKRTVRIPVLACGDEVVGKQVAALKLLEGRTRI